MAYHVGGKVHQYIAIMHFQQNYFNIFMKKVIYLIITYISIINVSAQKVNGKFDYHSSNPEVIYSLELFGKEYNLKANQYFSGGSVAEVFLSSGFCKIKGNNIELVDRVHKFKMTYTYSNNYITANSTLYPLLNKRFNRIGKANTKVVDKFKLDVKIANNIRLYNKKSNIIYHTLYYGNYLCQGYMLKLQNPFVFEYSYEGNVILRGSFKRIHNELQLYDYSLKHTFYFSIYDKTIIDNFLIFGYELKLQFAVA